MENPPCRFALPFCVTPIEAKAAQTLPDGDGWQFEPKRDGFRCLVFKRGADIDLRANSGKQLVRYFPEVAAMVAQIKANDFVLDGELVIEVDSRLSRDRRSL